MAFEKRTWLARIGAGLNKFIIGNKDSEGKQTLTNAPDSVTQIGDVISAENLNDLEDRIEAGLNEKQNVLTFDDVPTENSDNPVKSGGVYSVINGMKAKCLWYNPSPTSSFSTQTINLSEGVSDSTIAIEYSMVTAGGLSKGRNVRYFRFGNVAIDDIVVIYLGDCIAIVESGVYSFSIYSRTVQYIHTAQNDQLRFFDAVRYGSASSEVNDTLVVPQAVYKIGDIVS